MNICNVGRRQFCSLSIFFKTPDLFNLKVATIMFKARQNILPPNLQKLFEFENITIYNTRRSDVVLNKNIARTNHQSINICGVKLYKNIIASHNM